ncbi:MAG TPA: hypothetical protein VM575_21130 [Nocardioides sp.]|jgi:hypothetical protein|nr:hypothetical protein [Nocardioides sp.]
MGKTLLAKVGGIGVAIIVAIAFYFIQGKGQEKIAEATAPDVGDCINVSGTVNAKTTDKKCDDADATYEVRGDDGKCDPNEQSLTLSVGATDSGNVAKLCIGLNAHKGDCFSGFDTSDPKKVDCAEVKGDPSGAKIASVGKVGDKCANPSQPVAYKTRNILMCVVPTA